MNRLRWIGTVMFWVLACLLVGTTTAYATSGSGTNQYIVHPGDTLYRIAVTHGVTVRELAAANGIQNVNRIRVGQVLRIPRAEPPILLEKPASGARVSSPVRVSGRANVFEGLVSIRILDGQFREVGSGSAMAAMGEYAPFSADISYVVSDSQWGYVDVFWISPKDGTEMDKVTVRVFLQKRGPTPTRTPGPTPTPPPVPTATPSPVTGVLYHVHPGDTLFRIALGHRVTVRDIMQANRLRSPSLIYVGQPLLIPSRRPSVILTSPANDQSVGNPVTVRGQSDTFEALVVIDVLDQRFRRVGRATAMGGTLGTYAPFTATVPYTVSIAQWGYVEAYWPSPADGSKLDAVTARVRLSPSASASLAPVRNKSAGFSKLVIRQGPVVRYHTVRREETLHSIAARYGVTIRQLAAANGIRNVNRIYVGQRLLIP
ncbi:MAG: LysM peptidoglycan-binding domain-containing protein [Anaerolineae bacterium]|nr:LysM peptidoglycan-binding domain-containing protein [Anaerolineae bacterium]MDW8098200.1 LysM peptidoglycan-binding domain-containing protein [Anaerolineae bacterium]